jgi:hypothetical protein
LERASVLRNLDWRLRNLRKKRSFLWIAGSVSLILILSFVAAYLLDEPLRKKMEAEINNSLKGYTVRIERLDFHPFGLSLDLEGLTIYQSAHPDPPIAHIPELSASVHWKALLRGRLVADWELDNPSVRFDLRQFNQEASDETPIKERGWQDAVKAIYPLKINRFVIRNGNVTYSNHLKDGIARGQSKGKFMGNGPTQIDFVFRPETKGPDFDIMVRIENTDMRTMNDLFRAYGNFDVAGGIFSLYSEIKVRQGKIEGYVKPLFRDMDVYDERQDREKSVFRKLYEGLVGGIAGLLQNRPREEVATQTSISGDIESPQTSTWETVLRLVQNAFFKAILPGFDREVSQSNANQKRKPTS